MQLKDALACKRGEVVAFVGGGGKTTAMFRLAEELAASGRRVITTTTTRIFAAQVKLAPFHVCARGEAQALVDARQALREHRHLLVIGEMNEEGKAFGVEPSLVETLASLEEVDAILVEADGSRMRPFKAPADHEPVIPASTTLLVPVVGVDAVGVPLDEEHVHRPDCVSELTGVPLGSPIDPELVARVIAHPEGGLKNRPSTARVVPLVNKAQNVAQLLIARDIASQLNKYRAINSVAIGAVRNPSFPVSELHRRVAAVILAAGGSARMKGDLKQLLPWGDSTLVRHAVEVATHAGTAETVVVVGNRAAEVENALRDSGARIVLNPDWEQGRATSVRAAIAALSPEMAAALFINADQPFLTAQVLDTILQRYYQTLAPIVVPLYDGRTGSPVLFSRELFEELGALEGENGGRTVLQARRDEVEHVNVLNSRAAVDIDTPEEYRAAVQEAASRPPDGIFSPLRPEQ